MNLTPRDELNGINKTSFGIVLVLFILTVIASRIFNRIAQAENPQPDSPIGIAASVGFNVYNESIFTLTVPANGLFGDFERKPPGHTIPPGGSYNYQVSTNLYKTSIVNIYYSYDYRNVGQTRIGNFVLDLIVDSGALGVKLKSMRMYITGPINYYRERSNSTSLYIRN
ncbi:hypothetical protein M3223_14690 [Paenibacillus pasadenensis]|uniref:hypothetical protein n=1 Tax=Paenibacillus pasadenensis TaxID=217090 RepID=UPI0020403B6D|nr:hypothetical protein [Paenibacillus pasadenensis]MCM3748596.1 hypothetical protein [Paenibacillus pasadenensis]